MYALTPTSKVVDGAYVADLVYVVSQSGLGTSRFYDYNSAMYGTHFVDTMSGKRIETPLLYGGIPQLNRTLPVVYREDRVPRRGSLPWQPFAGVGAVVALVAYAGYRTRSSRRPKIAA